MNLKSKWWRIPMTALVAGLAIEFSGVILSVFDLPGSHVLLGVGIAIALAGLLGAALWLIWGEK